MVCIAAWLVLVGLPFFPSCHTSWIAGNSLLRLYAFSVAVPFLRAALNRHPLRLASPFSPALPVPFRIRVARQNRRTIIKIQSGVKRILWRIYLKKQRRNIPTAFQGPQLLLLFFHLQCWEKRYQAGLCKMITVLFLGRSESHGWGRFMEGANWARIIQYNLSYLLRLYLSPAIYHSAGWP